MEKSFEELVEDAIAQSHEGWDFSYIRDRWHSENPPWMYGDEVLSRLDDVESMLDMGTGGGEFLLTLHERASKWPFRVTATEGYAPNVSVAARNLEPIGVEVVGYESDEALPFEDASFDLVINRHGSFAAKEV